EQDTHAGLVAHHRAERAERCLATVDHDATRHRCLTDAGRCVAAEIGHACIDEPVEHVGSDLLTEGELGHYCTPPAGTAAGAPAAGWLWSSLEFSTRNAALSALH